MGLFPDVHTAAVARGPFGWFSLRVPKQILIVEDEADFQELLRYHLATSECEVSVAASFAEAMTQAGRIRPDLILLDIMLPDVDGLSLCEALKTEPALVEAPIWIISAAHSQTTRDIARASGAVEFFSKPVDFKLLKTRVAEWLHLPPKLAA